MSEYIEREVLQNAMYHEAFETDTEMQRWDSGCWIRYKLFENILDQQPTVDVPQWIPCSERLPYSQEDVLCDDDGRVTIGYYTDEEVGWHDTHSYRIYPTAWMPMPEPWKGEAK